MSRIYKDLTGQRFGRLVAIERAGTRNGYALWKCKCDCGKETEVISNSLKRGLSKSCGCLRTELNIERHFIHGMTHTKLFKTWQGMIQRCTNSKETSFKNYGGRGISVCNEWSDFISFYTWSMNSGYNDKLTIDRIDNDGDYEPGNCTWSTCKEQANNKRNNVLYEYKGNKKTISQWSDIYGISYSVIALRFKRGWSIEKTLTTPIIKPGKKVNFDFFEQKRKEGKKISQACIEYGITKRHYYYALEQSKKEK